MPNPSVSYVVPCYNYGKYLRECLASIFQQEEKNFEIIAVDDASTDETLSVLSEFSDPRLKVISHTKNLGHVVSINEGLSLAQGEFVTRIDSDDRYRPYFISKTLPLLKAQPTLGLVFGDVSLINDKGETSEDCVRSWQRQGIVKDAFVQLLETNFIPAPTVIARREAWAKALPILSGFSHSDWYLNLKMAREFPIYYCQEILADYRVHSHNLHTKIQHDKSEEITTFKILEIFFSSQESDSRTQQEKARRKNKILSAQFLRLATKYFSFGMMNDSRRCLYKGLTHNPLATLQRDLLPVWASSFIGKQNYEAFKSVFRRYYLEKN